jgi:hypothetical protein
MVTKKTAWADDGAFVRAWQRSKSVRQVAETLGCTVASASQRASYLRSRGVAVKMMRPGHPTRLDVGALNRIAKKAATP